MSRRLANRTRDGIRLVLFSVLYATLAMAVSITLIGIFVLATDSGDTEALTGLGGMSGISDALVRDGDGHALPAEAARKLREANRWAMLVGEDGRVAWSLDLPDGIPTTYGLTDVASFVRWYLHDYPVTTLIREDGLLVVGSPKGSLWRYEYTSEAGNVAVGLAMAASLFFANVLLALLVARAYARHSWQERDRARNEWVAAVSHDVRTPLAVVLAEASALAEDPNTTAKQRARAEGIVAQSSRAAGLVADLNAANRLRYSMEPVDATDVALAPVVRTVAAEALNSDDGTHPLGVTIGPACEDICVRGDAALLRRMLANLVGNSMRHNPQGCSIRIKLTQAPARLPWHRRCTLLVSDDGRGLGSDMLETLRRRPTDELPEHGLGLVIVRRIAAAHGGEARFWDNEGGGCRCEVTLPLVRERRSSRP